jgi:hypothetical protein
MKLKGKNLLASNLLTLPVQSKFTFDPTFHPIIQKLTLTNHNQSLLIQTDNNIQQRA